MLIIVDYLFLAQSFELEQEKKRNHELSEQYSDRLRQFQKIQVIHPY